MKDSWGCSFFPFFSGINALEHGFIHYLLGNSSPLPLAVEPSVLCHDPASGPWLLFPPPVDLFSHKLRSLLRMPPSERLSLTMLYTHLLTHSLRPYTTFNFSTNPLSPPEIIHCKRKMLHLLQQWLRGHQGWALWFITMEALGVQEERPGSPDPGQT